MRCLFLLPMWLAGCMLAPYKMDIQQGNYIDQAMVAKLKPEMTRSQVRFILGTPLIADIFHPNRWDYVYLTGTAADVRVQRRIVAVFEGDKLKQVEDSMAPAETLSQASSEIRRP